MEKLKCAVIGLGWFGEIHLDTLNEFPIVDIKAICDTREDHLKEIGRKYAIENCYTNYHDLLNDKNIEIVVITTHVDTHAQIAADALNSGKHVFLEKPMANNLEECNKIIEACKKTDKFFMVGHICRFGVEYAIAKEEIENGKIGEIISLHAKRNLAKQITETHLNKLSSLFGDGVHDLDLAFWYTKSRPVSVYALTRKTRDTIIFDDVGWAMFKFENKAIVVIENVWCLPDNVPYLLGAEMEIIGTKGIIKIDATGSSFQVVSEDGIKYPPTVATPKVHGLRRGLLKEELDYFLKCILKTKRPEVITPEESRDVVYAIRMAEKSALENKIIYFKY